MGVAPSIAVERNESLADYGRTVLPRYFGAPRLEGILSEKF
jgi:hypothetical protein